MTRTTWSSLSSGLMLLGAGVVLLGFSVALAEYDRRHPLNSTSASTEPTAPKKKELPALLETAKPTPRAAPAASNAPFEAQLKTSEQVSGPLKGVLTGPFAARELHGGFGAVLMLVDGQGSTAIVRAVAQEPAQVVATRSTRINAMQVDGSTVFFAEGGLLLSMSARGGEEPQVRAAFAKAIITSLAPVGDTVFVSLMPVDQPLAEGNVGAVARVDTDGTVTLIAQDQARPRFVTADAREVFWVAGTPGTVFRGAADGTFSARLGDGEGPLALDGDSLVIASTDDLKRLPRAGGASVTLAAVTAQSLVASSGLVQYVANDTLFEVTAGASPREIAVLPAAARGLALGGTSLYILVNQNGSTLYAR